MTDGQPDVAAALANLKDFQRATVDYIFERMYTGPAPRRRFLLADEVGLGKTLVARGVVARAVSHLWEQCVQRIDVVYICSNSAIARQNVNRLQLPGMEKVSLASRITLLPKIVRNLSKNRVNFISFTPGTSFDMKSKQGVVEERVLLFHLLEETLGLSRSAAITLLQGAASRERFKAEIGSLATEDVDRDLANAFRDQVSGELLEEIRGFAATVIGNRKKLDTSEERSRRSAIVGTLRSILAKSCLHALEPDLIILDEFQRFKSLLDSDDDASRLAQHLFNYEREHEKARVLLLSATPYKMYTLEHETDEDHYADFLRTITFLLDGAPEVSTEWSALLERYRTAMAELSLRPEARDELKRLGAELESRLRRVMVRTERLAASDDRNGMLKSASEDISLRAPDLTAFVAVQGVATSINAGDVVEYWKSAPYLLNFMDEYELKEQFVSATEKADTTSLAEALSRCPDCLISFSDVRRYQTIDPQNARLRALIHGTVENGAWELLWVPPALPYYGLTGAFGNPSLAGFTKRLVFSSWKVVPKTIAALVTYEVERRVFKRFEEQAENTPEARRNRKALLRFTRDKRTNRLNGMPVVALVYPSTRLAELFDPMTCIGDKGQSAEAILRDTADQLRVLLGALPSGAGEEDERWYWAAPVLLDLAADTTAGRNDTKEWFRRADLDDAWVGEERDVRGPANDSAIDDEEETAWSRHVTEIHDLVMRGEHRLGKQPADLPEVLSLMAIAGPGVCALRALSRVTGGLGQWGASHRDAAGRIAHALVRLFNEPEAVACIRGRNREEPYWRRVLEYSADGCVQSVLDEYVHVLYELSGLAKYDKVEDVLGELCGEMLRAIDLRTANVGTDRIDVADRKVSVSGKERMRARFALRYGDERSEDGTVVTRGEQVAAAFNSPFWPFVLATTSVGQEGLDFHPYCHAVVHWNLPSNPVDLEQREGRVHRYKGHAVRKNVAKVFGSAREGRCPDAWQELFDRALAERRPGEQDLVPYWVYPIENGSFIERHVPALPLSRDLERLGQLRRALAVYRMVFGQNRQDDLVECLLKSLPEDQLRAIVGELKIDLAPRATEAAV